MAKENAVVAVYNTHTEAEAAINRESHRFGIAEIRLPRTATLPSPGPHRARAARLKGGVH